MGLDRGERFRLDICMERTTLMLAEEYDGYKAGLADSHPVSLIHQTKGLMSNSVKIKS